MELVTDVDPDHIKLIAERAAWEAVNKAREEDTVRIEAAVTRGINAFFAQQEIKPEHWAYLRLQLKEREDNWSAVRKTIINLLLAGALVVGGQALWQSVAAKILAADQGRPAHRSGTPTPEGQP